MSFNINAYQHIVIVGMGQTGLSCAKFLHAKNIYFTINDSRESPPALPEITKLIDENRIIVGGFNRQNLLTADLVILSQGVPLRNPIISQAYQKGVKFINDVDLFCTFAKAPIVAITGSNAKSTVTTLVGNIIKEAGYQVSVGGNIGTALLTLLLEDKPDYYVVELSNFQLDLTHELEAEIACILNLSPDHLDRYDSYMDYIEAKHRIYHGAKKVIYNADDALTHPKEAVASQFFTLDNPTDMHFGLREQDGAIYLCKGNKPFMNVNELKTMGKHHWQNALAAAAITHELGIDLSIIANSLKTFRGLAHRCQCLATIRGVTWFNDSKGTNIGATIAAINGLGPVCEHNLILIAGGQGKGADFSELIAPVKTYISHIIVFGEDKQKINLALKDYAKVIIVDDLKQAVNKASTISQQGDLVLFSPACASFDMFDNFEARGEVYMGYVKELSQSDH